MSSLGFTSKEQRNLGLLVHLMTTNPKILYSPIGSQVDKVIQKASMSSIVGAPAELFAYKASVTHSSRSVTGITFHVPLRFVFFVFAHEAHMENVCPPSFHTWHTNAEVDGERESPADGGNATLVDASCHSNL